ncbi:MAG: chemotaxis protein CheW [Phycisphaerales bacterium]|nr:chemotaxis protein CheW [Phycisphaerales bacterium]MCB9855926.1 chemotaxis protein CheW [Phycisphaerales bacterium]MCB9864093.1 chemotaxis protein CheW [Phycisphaerales bacterium]
MTQQHGTSNQWLVFTLSDQKYAVHVAGVRELTPSRDHEIRQLPQTPEHVVGALSLRGRVIAVRDLRTMIGLNSLDAETKEIIQLLEAREQDHIKWIDELKRSVNENREFTLARDPHKCAFGKWYDALVSDEGRLQKLTNSNFTLYRLIGQLDTPHKTIHSIADKVTRFMRDGDTDAAHRIIDQTSQQELGTMMSLLGQIRELLHSLRKPLIIVLESDNRQLGVQVDSVDSVVRIQPDQIQPLPDRLGQSALFTGIAQLKDESELLMLLDGANFFTDSTLIDVPSTEGPCQPESKRPEPASEPAKPRELAAAM